MTWLDWIIVVVPVLVVLIIGLKSQQYVKSVADFLAAGRVAGRYVICVAAGEAGMGLISLVAIWENTTWWDSPSISGARSRLRWA